MPKIKVEALRQRYYLEPIRILRTLLSSKNLNKTLIFVASHVACISTRKVSIQGRRIELSENIDLGHIAIQAVANRDINQPIVCSKRNSWLCPLLGQWVKTSPSTTSKYNAKHTLQNYHQQNIFSSNYNHNHNH